MQRDVMDEAVLLARRAGVSRTTINRLEKGKVNVKVTDLIAVARAVGGTVTELLDEDQALIAERAARILDDPNFTSGMVRLGGAYRRQGERDRARTLRVIHALADEANTHALS
jgi:transcriptional regulator with XRE-family HTH domain